MAMKPHALLDALVVLDTAVQNGANQAVRERLWRAVVREFRAAQAARESWEKEESGLASHMWHETIMDPMGGEILYATARRQGHAE